MLVVDDCDQLKSMVLLLLLVDDDLMVMEFAIVQPVLLLLNCYRNRRHIRHPKTNNMREMMGTVYLLNNAMFETAKILVQVQIESPTQRKYQINTCAIIICLKIFKFSS